MKFLQICSKPPLPLVDGGAIAMNALTESLLSNGHQVKVVCIFTDKHDFMPDRMPSEYLEKTDIEGVYVDTNLHLLDVYSNFITRDPYNLNRFFSVDLDIRLTRILQREKFDFIILESLFTSPYLSTLRRNSSAKIILRSHNIEHHIWNKLANGERNIFKKIYLKYLSRKLQKAEISAWRSVDATACISETDTVVTQAFCKSKPVFLLPMATEPQPPIQYNIENTCFHIGSMDWLPNIEAMDWFIIEIWPQIQESLPQYQFHFAGRSMPRTFMNNENSKTHCHGEVESSSDFMRNHGIMVVPLRSGSGIRVKILEAFAMGIPVVATELAVRGLPVQDQEHFLLANSTSEWIAALKQLTNESERKRIGSNAHQFITSEFNAKKIGASFVQTLKTIRKK
jgi:glycosyltransferase involved in cell wall biosynthesis